MDVPIKLKCHIGQMFWHGGSFAKMTQDTWWCQNCMVSEMIYWTSSIGNTIITKDGKNHSIYIWMVSSQHLMINFRPCQRNLIKTFQNKVITLLFTKLASILFNIFCMYKLCNLQNFKILISKVIFSMSKIIRIFLIFFLVNLGAQLL